MTDENWKIVETQFLNGLFALGEVDSEQPMPSFDGVGLFNMGSKSSGVTISLV